MAEPVIINATKQGGVENAYIGTIGNGGYIYFNDVDFYRFKNEGTWENNVYALAIHGRRRPCSPRSARRT